MSLQGNQSKRGTVRVIRPNGLEYLLPLVMPDAAEGDEPTPVTVSRVGAFPEKVVTGGFSRISHPWLSSFMQYDWSGGGQIRDSQESTDISRYWDGTLETRYPKALTLPPYVGTVELEGNADPCVVCGDIRYSGTTRVLITYGTSLQSLDADFTLTAIDDLSINPVTNGVAFRGSAGSNKRLFIPGGADGYEVFDPSDDSVSGALTGVEPLNFVEWNKNLWCIDAEGQIFYNATGNDGDWTLSLRIDGDGEAISLQRYFDQNGQPALFAITDRDVQQISIADDEAYVTSLEYAPHPDAGRAAIRWREWLSISYGVDLARYDGGTISYVGLTRDHGLPAELRGAIRSSAAGWNDLFVLLEGASVSGDSGDGYLETDVEGDLLLSQSTALSSVMRLDSLGGWHPLWKSSTTGQDVTNIFVSAANGRYMVLWGFANKLYHSELPMQFQNPAENPQAKFALYGYLISPWLDFDLTGFDLILASGSIRHKNCDSTHKIRFSYQIDNEDDSDTWHELPEIATVAESKGATRFRFGTAIPLPNNTTHYTGQVLGRVRYKVEMIASEDDEGLGYTTQTPLIEAIELTYMPKMSTYLSWSFVVDCTTGSKTGMYNDLSAHERQILVTQLIEDEFVAFNYRGDEWHSVKFTGAGGADQSNVFAGDREVTAVATEEMKL